MIRLKKYVSADADGDMRVVRAFENKEGIAMQNAVEALYDPLTAIDDKIASKYSESAPSRASLLLKKSSKIADMIEALDEAVIDLCEYMA